MNAIPKIPMSAWVEPHVYERYVLIKSKYPKTSIAKLFTQMILEFDLGDKDGGKDGA